MIRVRTGSRLHFGLIRLPPTPWPADGRRYFGGVGLMIDQPAVELELEPASTWSFSGAHAARVQKVVDRIQSIEPRLAARPCAVRVIQAPPEHCGFGLGTQLGLTVAQGLATLASVNASIERLAACTGRGLRSAIGAHGFAGGGLIRDSGKSRPDDLGTLGRRVELPADWRAVVARPAAAGDWSGGREAHAFANISSRDLADELDGLADTIMSAATRHEFVRFGQSVHEFNALAGEQFRDAQGGRYASTTVESLVEAMGVAGAAGAGQSSWGPAVFGFAESAEAAGSIVNRLRSAAPSSTLISQSAVRNDGCTGA